MHASHPIRAARRLLEHLAGRPLAIYVVMGASAALGTLLSVDLLHLAYLNADLILNYGVMALFDGALVQAVELLLLGYLALACYVVFKCCEKMMVETLLHPAGDAEDPAA